MNGLLPMLDTFRGYGVLRRLDTLLKLGLLATSDTLAVIGLLLTYDYILLNLTLFRHPFYNVDFKVQKQLVIVAQILTNK